MTAGTAIKVDVQGFEDRVIAGGTNVFRHATVAVTETTFYLLYERQPLLGRICEYMLTLGYRSHGALDVCRSRGDGRTLQEDSLFIRLPIYGTPS